MNPLEKGFRLVVVECPYSTLLTNPMTEDLYMKFMKTKLVGYLQEYSYGVLPFGAYDLIANLVLLCRENDGALSPVMVFKSTSLERCDRFRLPFEMYDLVPPATAPRHRKAMDELLASARRQKVDVGYNSSWTVHPDARHDRSLKEAIREASVAIFYHHYTHYRISEVLIGGAVRFKVDKLQKLMGFLDLARSGQSLPAIDCPFLFGEKTALMHLTEFSEMARSAAEKYRFLWDQRLTIEEQAAVPEKIPAAA
jgi:hypothetical protein